MTAKNFTWATGRRKSSTARIRLIPGQGNIHVNGETIENYFGREVDRIIAKQSLAELGAIGKYDIWANCDGGGHSGQAGAIRHGISRALVSFDPTLRAKLKAAGYLTRDPRKKERKKPGLHGARRACQFSKR